MAGRIGRAALGGALGFIAGGAATFGSGLAAAELFAISQAEGAYVMGLVFFWVPLGAVIGLVAGVMIALRRRQ